MREVSPKMDSSATYFHAREMASFCDYDRANLLLLCVALNGTLWAGVVFSLWLEEMNVAETYLRCRRTMMELLFFCSVLPQCTNMLTGRSLDCESARLLLLYCSDAHIIHELRGGWCV